MGFSFKIISKSDYSEVIPLVEILGDYKVSRADLIERFEEMKTQNYECAGVYDGKVLIGVSGIWFSTRHYAGKSAEVDHVYINEDYRGQGLGKKFFAWLYKYCKEEGCNTMELNTYVTNHPSHKFYYNEGFNILGYHFLKKL